MDTLEEKTRMGAGGSGGPVLSGEGAGESAGRILTEEERLLETARHILEVYREAFEELAR